MVVHAFKVTFLRFWTRSELRVCSALPHKEGQGQQTVTASTRKLVFSGNDQKRAYRARIVSLSTALDQSRPPAPPRFGGTPPATATPSTRAPPPAGGWAVLGGACVAQASGWAAGDVRGGVGPAPRGRTRVPAQREGVTSRRRGGGGAQAVPHHHPPG